MQFETIRYEVADGIATLTLNRPERLNAFTPTMMDELIAALDAADADDAVRAVILTGAGCGFCAGADLGAGADTFATRGAPAPDSEAARDSGGRLTLRLFRCLKPVIAAVNGPAVGIGATMTLACDIRLASEDARFGFVFARRGIVPEAASAWFLPRIVGIGRALEWCYSGRVFGAEEAHAGGLVRSVHASATLLDDARALAAEFAAASAPVSVALIRQMLWRGLGMAHPMEAHRADSRGILSRGASADAAEGVTAFLEKRAPAFPDRVSADLPDLFPDWIEPGYR